MNRSLPHRRRQARAIAISATVEAKRRAVMAKIALAVASAALVWEAATVARALLAGSHS